MNWTPDLVAKLRKFTAHESKLKSREIAEILGCSKNAVIGACARYGVQLQHPQHKSYDPNDPPKPRKPRAKRPPIQHKTRIAMPEITCEEVEPLHLSLVDLPKNSCRYPYGDGPFTFCGHPVWDEGQTYCAVHHKLCYYRTDSAQREKTHQTWRAA